MMRSFEVVKHVRCLDAAFLIKKVQFKGPDYWKVRGWWVTLGYSAKPLFLSYRPETIKISKQELPNWKVVQTPDILPQE